MIETKILDCTLRDGGYCNNWKFGYKNIKKIIQSLVKANIDIIECGFLTNKQKYNQEYTKFESLNNLYEIIPKQKEQKMFLLMMNYGEYNAEELPDYNRELIDGIRVAFHKKNYKEALKDCSVIKRKGFKVFVQAMMSISYSDDEFYDLIDKVNKLRPYAFYIVDSFGMMKRNDMIHFFNMIEERLDREIVIGFHSHNNMQLAYANAQTLVDINATRNLIVDSSIFGMGRGAGNLNTELFSEYLNNRLGTRYNLQPLLCIMDEVINLFYQENQWGYSLPNYLSALYNLHPSYAFELSDKNTLSIDNINEIFTKMDDDKKLNFDKNYIEMLYTNYMAREKGKELHFAEFYQKLIGKTILLIAPGKSAEEEKVKIKKAAEQKDVVSISLNFCYPYFDTDFLFVSNIRRFKELEPNDYSKTIVTSNINKNSAYMQVSYEDLINDIEVVKDNSGLMAIKFLINLGVKKILLAGMDGYEFEPAQNYFEKELILNTKPGILKEMNKGIREVLKTYADKIDISFLTKPKYIIINDN